MAEEDYTDNTRGLATMLAFLSQNQNRGQTGIPQLPPAPNMQLPDTSVQAPQQGGGGVLKGILGNLASSYLSNKLEKYQQKQATQELVDAYKPAIDAQYESETNPDIKKHLGGLRALINTKNPLLVQRGLSGITDLGKAQETAALREEPNLIREVVDMYPHLKLGTPEFAAKAAELKKMGSMNINMGNPEAPLTQFEMEHLVDKKGVPVPQVPLGFKRGDAAAQGLSVGKVSTETEAKTAASTVSSQDLAGKLSELRSKGHNISGLSGAIIDYRSGNELLPAAINEGLTKLGYKVTPEQTQMVSYTKSLSNQLIQAMRGAQVGPAEQGAFEKSLPVAGQPEALFDQNLETTLHNLNILNERKAALRGLPNASTGKSTSTVTGGVGGLPKVPPIGFVHKHHKFIGGDPSSPSSWEKL